MSEPSEAQQLTDAFDRLSRVLDKATSSNRSVSTVTVNAGGVAVWITATISIAMMIALPATWLWMHREGSRADRDITEIREKLDVQQAYLNVLMQAPPKPQEP